MAPSRPRKYQCELATLPLKNCLANLPFPLVNVLLVANKPAQSFIIELLFRQNVPRDVASGAEPQTAYRSLYLGWTGLQSKRKVIPVISRDVPAGRSGAATKEKDIPLVEIDSTFARTLGLVDGQQVGVFLHPEPQQCHTIHVEPVTAADWELLELHANFLEIHMLSQIRAIPNPIHKAAAGFTPHHLTLHLSPTSTANIVVTSLSPSLPPSVPFAKISADAEVVVAPKTRNRSLVDAANDKAAANGADDRSVLSSTRSKIRRNEATSRRPLFLRGIDRSFSMDYFDNEDESDKDVGLKVWVDWSILASRELRGVTFVLVSIVRPCGLQTMPDIQHDVDSVKITTRVVAQICPWEEAPDSSHVATSTGLCSVLGLASLTGQMIRLEAAPPQIPRSTVRSLRVLPFIASTGQPKDGVRFGSKSRSDREEAAKWLLVVHGRLSRKQLLLGPITDGMLLPARLDLETGTHWPGGVLRFEPPLDATQHPHAWFMGSDRKIVTRNSQEHDGSSPLVLELLPDASKPPPATDILAAGHPLPQAPPMLICVEKPLKLLMSHVRHRSSVFLTGGRGSGKTALCQALAHNLRRSTFHHITYVACRSLSTDEMRISSVKDTLSRAFGFAAWAAGNGGNALIVLDDLDAICPAITELQVGNDNGRSRQISELIVALTSQFCGGRSSAICLATAKSREDVNDSIIGGHIAQELVDLPAPDKLARRDILRNLVLSPLHLGAGIESIEEGSSLFLDADRSNAQSLDVDNDGSGGASKKRIHKFAVDASVDFLDIAGRADGFMPGDLLLLAARARSEAIIRSLPTDVAPLESDVTMSMADFTAALKDFVPLSLRNVTLQHSSVSFASIGGLNATRQALRETLQYPTLYAPIFARCPLRLRSGLLLYGYPGCGKTLLASAAAGECGLNFISVKGPEILNKYIGASEKSVRDLFERAQAARPCVLFFDEFDSVAPKRGHDSTGVTDRVVNQLLTQMDGAEGLVGVYVLAATSRPDLIDPALLRPGRLDKSLLCDMPDLNDRFDILCALVAKIRIDSSLLSYDSKASNKGQTKTLREVARRTEGYSGADLQAVIYNAHLAAIHDVLGLRRLDAIDANGGGGADTADRGIPDFTHFRFGDGSVVDGTPQTVAKEVTERNEITQGLISYRTAQSRMRAAKRAAGNAHQASTTTEPELDAIAQEPMIEWDHLERSLAQTRASIGRAERERLALIYHEFVVGRNGEMPSGQGGSEIGGRSSLM